MEGNDARSWFGRHRRFIVEWAIISLLLGAVGAFVLVPLGIRSCGAFNDAVHLARTNQDVLAALGAPVNPGWFVKGSIRDGIADLAIPIRGTHSRGTLHVVAEWRAGLWHLTLAKVAMDGVWVDLLQSTEHAGG